MLIDVPSVDYVRLTSFDVGAFGLMRDFVKSGEWVEGASWRQYSGLRSDLGFFGVGLQRVNGRGPKASHGLLDVPGPVAQRVVSVHDIEGAKCTRIDLQLTVAERVGYRARDFKDGLEGAEWVRRRKVTMVEGPAADGLDTVYIGSRQSDRLIRVYVKLDADKRRYVRFEVEYKGPLAVQVYGRVKADGRQVAGLLHREYQAVPAVEDVTWGYLGDVLAGYGLAESVSVPRVRSDDDGRLEYLERVCMPVLSKLLRSHESRSRALQLVGRVINESIE